MTNNNDDLAKKINAKLEQEQRQVGHSERADRERQFSEADLYKSVTSQQDGDAWLFRQLFRDRFCYDRAAGRWYEWQGHYWAEDKIGNAARYLDKIIDLYAEQASEMSCKKEEADKKGGRKDAELFEKKEKEYLKKISQLQKNRWKKDVLELAATGEHTLGITGEERDLDPWVLGCTNGVLELRTGSFRPGKPDDYIKTPCNTQWKGFHEQCPIWEKFLIEIFSNDLTMFAFIRRLLGYCVTGLTVDHILPIFWGSRGRNGKGTFFNTLHHVLGPLIGSIQSEMLLDQGKPRASSGPRPDIMALRGRRIAYASETDDGRKMDVGKVKWLVGGDILCGRDVFGRSEVNFVSTHKLFLQTNHKPKVDPTDDAIWERIKLIPFNLSFVDEPKEPYQRRRDPFLLEKLKAEASGILAWIVSGCLEWQKTGLMAPDTVKSATQSYQEEEDIIGHFLNDVCFSGPDKKVKANDFYSAYTKWCEENGHRPISGTKFGQRMSGHFEWERGRSGKYYFGIGLANDPVW